MTSVPMSRLRLHVVDRTDQPHIVRALNDAHARLIPCRGVSCPAHSDTPHDNIMGTSVSFIESRIPEVCPRRSGKTIDG